MTTIKLELSPTVEAKLDKIIELLSNTPAQPEAATPAVVEPEKPAEAVQPEAPTEEPVEEPAPAKTYTQSDVQQAVVRLSAAGKKAQVREIVKAYAERVSAIPADKYAEVMEKLTALEV